MSSIPDDEVEAQVRHWLRDAVIGLNLCPFAHDVLSNDRLTLVVSDAIAPDACIERALGASIDLLDESRTEPVTTLVVYSRGLSDFGEYLDVVHDIEVALEHAGATGQLQVASFHPRYQFADTEFDDPANWSNRSPYPIVHLLREHDVSLAVASHPNVDNIPARNIARLRELDVAGIARIWSGWQNQC